MDTFQITYELTLEDLVEVARLLRPPDKIRDAFV
jgi:hypothetical protein